ncbi:DUF6962 family protein [Spirosoma endophyticum]|uniref:Uncharacterized protein n=1 Tax=Spirosoma endophyticum TaxID=662367 RepID=A0A1I1UGP4_9BACT|nr:hypothetical protein [Spirosoma endophyticum]SFD69874.1 hypothetical protein SAMN05216167_106264 [Spirosoma endophyticum]
MIFSHILSGFILAGAGIGVFWHFFGRIALFNRLLWGFFLLTTSLAALISVVHFAGYESLEPLRQSMIVLSDSLGVVCAVTAVYALLNQRTLSLITFVATILFGLFLFISLSLPDGRVFTPIVPSLGILVLMLLAVFSLLQRNKRGLWVVLAAMMMGLATKADSFNNFVHPTDFYHYATTLALWFFGKASDWRAGTRLIEKK